MARKYPLLRWPLRLLAALTCLGVAGTLLADGIYEPVELKRKEPQILIEAADQLVDQFRRRSLLFGNEEVVLLVRRIGHELAPEPTDDYIDYQFFVLRDPSPNAFALPNGHIYVHTGMLARLADESQLAGLLAHEITHVAGHHSIVQYRVTAREFFAGLLDVALGGAGFLGALMSELALSRELEREADDRAPMIVLSNGYDPHAIPELLEVLVQDYEGLVPRLPSIWTTHPDPGGRAASSWALVGNMPATARNSALFDQIVFPLRVLTIQDYIQNDYPFTALALVEQLIARYPDEIELRLLKGDAYQALGANSEDANLELTNREKRRNARQRVTRTREERLQALLATEVGQQAFARNMANAHNTYMTILEDSPDYARAYRGLGEVNEALGQHREAAAAYLDYLRRAPDAADRQVIVSRLTGIRDQLRQ